MWVFPKPRGVLTIQISGPHPRPTESKFPGCDHKNRYFLKIPRHPEAVDTRPLLAIIPEGFEHQYKYDRKTNAKQKSQWKGPDDSPFPLGIDSQRSKTVALAQTAD